jgi:TolC family type I secretion outer membrane protein
VLSQAVTAYMDVWRDQAVLQLNINNERVLQRQLEATNDRFEVGEVTRTDVAQAESRLSSATADRIQAEGNLTTSRAVFQEVVGFAPGILDAPPPVGALPPSLEQTLVQARQANPAIVSATFAERAAQNQVRVVFGELLPTVSLSGELSHEEDQFTSGSESDQAAILAQVTVPLYQSGFVSSRVREAKQVANQRRLEVADIRRNVDQLAISSWQALGTARAQIDSFQSAVRATDIALDGVQQENLVGARTVLDVLDAEQEFLDARVNLVVAQRDEIVASYQVVSAIGRLTAADLQLPVDAYDPEADYEAVRDRWFGISIPEEKPLLAPIAATSLTPPPGAGKPLSGPWSGLSLPEKKPTYP